MPELLFVYGTLKKGFYNESTIRASNGVLLGEFETIQPYGLYSIGAYPAAWHEGKDNIRGEVYTVADLRRTDWLEGYPDQYTRVKTKVRSRNNTKFTVDAWMYFLNPVFNDKPPQTNLISGGEWKSEDLHYFVGGRES